MLALVSNTAHADPHLLYEQTLAYNKALGDDCIHVINVNSLRSRAFFERARSFDVNFATIGNVVFAQPERMVHRPSTLGVHATNIAFAIKAGITADYVVLHTSSDLPFRPGLKAHIAAHDIGQKEPVLLGRDSVWNWHRFAAADELLLSFLRKLSIRVDDDDGPWIPYGRFEGSFHRWGLMMEMLFFLASHFGFDEETHWMKPYPLEEIVLAALAGRLAAKGNLRRTRNFVLVANEDRRFSGLVKRKPFTEDHIPALTGVEDDIYSFKFAPPADSPVRDWVFEQLGIPRELRRRETST